MTNAKWIAAAEQRGADAPILSEDGPQFSAASAARACLHAGADLDEEVQAYLQINLANALRLCGAQCDDEAQEAFERALKLRPDKGAWWHDYGLLHKWRGRFSAALDCFFKAQARSGEERSVQWNIAICATALGQGDIAAGVWQNLGMQASLNEKSGMPQVQDIPPRLIRVLSKDEYQKVYFECLWVTPLSPCHGVVSSPSFGDAPIDAGDVVLWDGAPVGSRSVAGQDMAIFPLLEILRRGEEKRFAFVGRFPNADALEALSETLLPAARLFFRPDASSLQCAGCAQGVAMADHDHDSPIRRAEPRTRFGKVILAGTPNLSQWSRRLEAKLRQLGISLAIPQLYEALADTKKAGQHHKAWQVIESRMRAERERS